MKISWNYLQSLFAEPLDKELVLERLTMAGLEVEDRAWVAPSFSGVVVGQVIECERHPDADKLSVCMVNVNQAEPLQIVCGASNVKVGVKVPCAKVGALLPGDFKIAERKMRGVVSHGMLCSGDEIGCPDDVDGLLLLPDDAPVGLDIRDYLDLNDEIVEFKITPNRGDCLSYIGLAREIGALIGASPKLNLIQEDHLVNINHEFKLNVEASEACPHYVGLVINKIDNSKPSPVWLVRTLARSGIRSISPVVDITNYVMLVLGQPMHAFDLTKIGNELKVRFAKTTEKINLIDGKEVDLCNSTLIIADQHDNPAAIAGVMGGIDSGVNPETTSILLESAFFAPDAIRGKAKNYGVNSDSAFRFERGVDPEIQHDAINLAASLLVEICGGVVGNYVHHIAKEQIINSRIIDLDFTQIDSFVGQKITRDEICTILNRLGCQVVATNDKLQVTTPSYRFDLTIKEDIIEEIVRVYGYDRIEAVMPALTYTIDSPDQHLIKLNTFKQIMLAHGFNEIISYAFIEEKYSELLSDKQKPLIRLQNPIAGLNVLRNNLLTDLVKALENNVNRGHDSVRLFELARVFHGEEPNQQPLYLAGLIYGKYNLDSWSDASREIDFYDLKFVVEELLSAYGNLKFMATDKISICHPGRTAVIEVDGQPVGFIGQLHPGLSRSLDFDKLPYLFEINLEFIRNLSPVAIQPVSKFQKVSRDLAFVFEDKTAIGDVLGALRQASIPFLASVRVFDIFQGGNLANNQKSVAFNFIFQADKTLSEEEVSVCLTTIKQLVTENFGAQLR